LFIKRALALRLKALTRFCGRIWPERVIVSDVSANARFAPRCQRPPIPAGPWKAEKIAGGSCATPTAKRSPTSIRARPATDVMQAKVLTEDEDAPRRGKHRAAT
jgi:hypothetical protein